MNRFLRRVCRAHARVRVAFALLPALAIACDGAGPTDGARARAHAAAIVAFGPRPPESEALRRAGDYLMAELRKLGLEPREQVWEHETSVYGAKRRVRLRNVWTQIDGADPVNGPILLLAAHYDSKLCDGHPDPAHNFPFVGALDSAASCGLLLELARLFVAKPTGFNVWIAWFDGEECLEFEWNQQESNSLMGSRHFAATMSADKTLFPKDLATRMRAMVLLDLLGDNNMKIDRDTRSSPELLDLFARAAAAIGFTPMFVYDSPMTDDHVPFRDRGVRVLDLIDFRFRYDRDGQQPGDKARPPADGTYTKWWHKPSDTMDQVSAASLATVGNLIWAALPLLEREIYGH